MLFLVVIALGVASVPLAGGRLSALADLRFVGVPWLVGVLLVQVLILAVVPDGTGVPHDIVYAATFLAAAAFFWVNRRVPGLALLALGGGLNAIAVVSNGGVMPARPGALEAAGRSVVEEGFRNSAAVNDPNVPWLGDYFAIPDGWPLSNVFSVGDVVLAIGAFVLLHVTCGSRLTRRRKPSGGGDECAPVGRRGSSGPLAVPDGPPPA